MVDLDLDIVNGKQRTIKLLGREVKFKDITMEEHLESEMLVKMLEGTPLVDSKSIETIRTIKNDYLMLILDVTEEEASKLTLKQYHALRRFIDRQDLYDQGFTDKDIDVMEKKALKKQMAQI